MTDTSFCPTCGDPVDARARFCPSCGARQDEVDAPEDRPAPRFPTEAVLRAVPGPADDDTGFATPAPSLPTAAVIRAVPPPRAADAAPVPARGVVVAAALAGSAAAGFVLAAGLLLALITPDASIIGVAGVDASLVVETFRQAVGTLLAPIIDPGFLLAGSRRIHPMLLVVIPLAALGVATRWQLPRTAGAPPLARFAWALLIAVPFALWMLVFAVLGSETESTNVSPSAGNAFVLGLLWGVVGGALGAASSLPLRDLVRVPPAARQVLVAVVAALRPLCAVLVACTALALVGWLVQVGANAGDVRSGRSTVTALIEETAFAAEHGIHLAALAAGVLFRPDSTTSAVGLPFPVDAPNELPGADGAFRIFAYADALPAVVFVPALVVLLGLVGLGALYAGFAAARAAGARTLPLAAAWGAITGPAWAVAMAVAIVFAGGLLHGDAGDGSAFAIFLLGGAALGAAGGALSSR